MISAFFSWLGDLTWWQLVIIALLWCTLLALLEILKGIVPVLWDAWLRHRADRRG